MYKSPIEIIYGQAQTQMENEIFRVVQSYTINVDKAELIRVLHYDRNQYSKGYADGKADAVARGEWIAEKDEYEICATDFMCSNCRETFCSSEMTDKEFLSLMKYCPNCGAKMDTGRDDMQ